MNTGALTQLNKNFYDRNAKEFSATRQKPWQGWKRVGNTINSRLTREISILDLGCGNGRFLKFFYTIKDPSLIRYTGVDISQKMLGISKASFKTCTHTKFLKMDVFKDLSKIKEKFNVISAFGITHHMPEEKSVGEWVSEISSLLNPKGLVILTFWNYLQDKRFAKTSQKVDGAKSTYTLGWGNKKRQRSYRFFTKEDIKSLISTFENNDVKLVESFESDGRSNNLNNYFIFSR